MQSLVQVHGIAHWEQLDLETLKAQPRQQSLGLGHLLLQDLQVLRRFLGSAHHPDRRGAVGQGREPHIQPRAGAVPEGMRYDARRQALGNAQLGGPPQFVDHRQAALLAVQQQHGVGATGLGIGRQQGFQPQALLGRLGIGVAQSAAGTHRGAGTATHAQVRVDLDLLALFFRADGLGGAHVHTGIAAYFFVAAVGTEFLLVGEKAGFLEFAHLLAQVQQGLGQGLTCGRKITLRQGMRAEQRLCAQVEHQIEGLRLFFGRPLKINGACRPTHLDAGAVRLATAQVHLVIQANGLLRAGGHAGVAAGAQVQVDGVVALPGELESAQPTAQVLDTARQHRVLALL